MCAGRVSPFRFNQPADYCAHISSGPSGLVVFAVAKIN